MKKIILSTLTFLALVTGSQAQYFTKEYSHNSNSVGVNLTDGQPTVTGSPGHIMAGVVGPSFTNQDLMLVRVNQSGNISTNNFKNIYRLTTTTNVFLPIESNVKIAHLASGKFFVVGSYRTNPPNYDQVGFFTAVFQANGTVISAKGYTYNTTGIVGTYANSLCLSPTSSSQTAFIAGELISQTGTSETYIISVDPNLNTVLWSQRYILTAALSWETRDMVVDPSNQRLILIGLLTQTSSQDPFIMTVNSLNGSFLSANKFVYPGDARQSYKIMPTTFNASGFGPGFVLSGYQGSSTGSPPIWILRIDQNLSTIYWNKIIVPQTGATNSGFSIDLIERINTTTPPGQYFCTTTIRNMSTLLYELTVIKLDDLGNFIEEYNYNRTSRSLYEPIIGIQTDGFTLYANAGTPVSNVTSFYTTKACFNGERCGTAVKRKISTVTNGSAVTFSPISVSLTGTGTITNFNLTLTYQSSDIRLLSGSCNPTTIVGCNNARVGAEESIENEGNFSIQAWPNPVDALSPILNLKFTLEYTQQVQFRVLDMHGREVYNQQISMGEGENQLSIELPVGLSKGMYFIQIIGDEYLETRRFVVD